MCVFIAVDTRADFTEELSTSVEFYPLVGVGGRSSDGGNIKIAFSSTLKLLDGIEQVT